MVLLLLEEIVMGIFYLKFFLTSILFSLIIGAALVRFNKTGTQGNFELILYSLGLGPVFTVLMLYYFLLFIPGQAHLFYIIGILAIYGVISIFSFKGFQVLGVQLKNWVKAFLKSWRLNFKNILYMTAGLGLLGTMKIQGNDE